MQNPVSVPREWLDGLLRHAEKVEKSQGDMRDQWVTMLLGYVSSARTLLKFLKS